MDDVFDSDVDMSSDIGDSGTDLSDSDFGSDDSSFNSDELSEDTSDMEELPFEEADTSIDTTSDMDTIPEDTDDMEELPFDEADTVVDGISDMDTIPEDTDDMEELPFEEADTAVDNSSGMDTIPEDTDDMEELPFDEADTAADDPDDMEELPFEEADTAVDNPDDMEELPFDEADTAADDPDDMEELPFDEADTAVENPNDMNEMPMDDMNETPTNDMDEMPTDAPDEIPTDDMDGIPTDDMDEMPTDAPDEIPTDDMNEMLADESDEQSEDGYPVKVLTLGGTGTTIKHPDPEQEWADLQEGVQNANKLYDDAIQNVLDDNDRILSDDSLSNAEKREALEQSKDRLRNIDEARKEDMRDVADRIIELEGRTNYPEDYEGNIESDVPYGSGDELDPYDFGSFTDELDQGFDEDLSQQDDVLPYESELSQQPDYRNDMDNEADYSSLGATPIEGMDAVEPSVDITPLDQTNQDIVRFTGDDGMEYSRFDHPEELQKILPYDQGINDYNKDQDCVLANLGSHLKAAGSELGENDGVGYALTHLGRTGEPLCDSNGCVYPEDIPDIWERFGIPADIQSSKNLENLANYIEDGRAVSIGVNSGNWWNMDNPEGIDYSDYIGDGGANHQIGLMSCERDMSGNVTNWYINDTGRGLERDACRKVPTIDIINATMADRSVATVSKKASR